VIQIVCIEFSKVCYIVHVYMQLVFIYDQFEYVVRCVYIYSDLYRDSNCMYRILKSELNCQCMYIYN